MNFFKIFYITPRFYLAIAALICFFVLGNYIPFFLAAGEFGAMFFAAYLLLEITILFNNKSGLTIERKCAERFSNGDENPVLIEIKSNYPVAVNLCVIDEIPYQFQKRDFQINCQLEARGSKSLHYSLRPVQRGKYDFGNCRVFVSWLLGFVQRRYSWKGNFEVAVYPSFMQMKKFEFMAITNHLTNAGIKKIRRIGHQMEFDHIREYVLGDDYRTINWKATARKAEFMVNQYDDEKSQQLISIIDMGRTMKSPFNGLCLLDYAINSTLVLSNIAMLKHDRAGLMCVNEKVATFLPPGNRAGYLQKIMDSLYRVETSFPEANFEAMYTMLKHKLNQRSLLMLYTNFEGLVSVQRQLSYFRMLAQQHVLIVVFFENVELREITKQRPNDTESIYIKAIAEKLHFEKKQIVKELQKVGVQSIFTEPANLTVSVINKYLEVKARGIL